MVINRGANVTCPAFERELVRDVERIGGRDLTSGTTPVPPTLCPAGLSDGTLYPLAAAARPRSHIILRFVASELSGAATHESQEPWRHRARLTLDRLDVDSRQQYLIVSTTYTMTRTPDWFPGTNERPGILARLRSPNSVSAVDINNFALSAVSMTRTMMFGEEVGCNLNVSLVP